MGILGVQEETQQGNIHMIKRHRNVELDKNKKQELYYRHKYQGQYLMTSEFECGS